MQKGALSTSDGKKEHVVLKRVKSRVEVSTPLYIRIASNVEASLPASIATVFLMMP